MAEQLANLARTTLNGAIDDDDTSIVVTDGSVFPSSGIFRVNIEDEILKVTARSSNTLTAVRGAEGTAAASHGNGAAVTGVVTRDALLRLGSRTVLAGAHGSRAAAAEENEGHLYVPNDGYSWARSTGSVWVPTGPAYPFTPPVDGDFAWVNQDGATVTAAKDAIVLHKDGAGNTLSLSLRVKTAPSPPYVITAALLMDFVVSKGVLNMGLCFRQSSGGAAGQIVTWGYINNQFRVFKYASPTSANVTYRDLGAPFQVPLWFRIADDNTNRVCSYSFNGVNFTQVHSVGRTDFITADQVGFFVNAQNSASPNHDANLTLLSWKES